MQLTGAWRDPISNRWITPRPVAAVKAPAPEPVDEQVAAAKTARIAGIWQAVVASASASSMADQHQE